MEDKNARIAAAGTALHTMEGYNSQLRNKELSDAADDVFHALRDLRDTQYLFDSGEKELVRFYERYLPYYLDILRQYVSLQDSANFAAIQASEAQLIKTMHQMSSMIRYLTKAIPQDEIDEANAKAKAEELRARLEEQRNNMLK